MKLHLDHWMNHHLKDKTQPTKKSERKTNKIPSISVVMDISKNAV